MEKSTEWIERKIKNENIPESERRETNNGKLFWHHNAIREFTIKSNT